MRRDFASTTILAVVAVFFLLVGFGGCNSRADGKDPVQAEKDKKTAQVAANLKPIGQHLENTGRPLEGGAVKTQAAVLDAVVEIDPKDVPAPIVSYAEWQRTLDDKAQALRVAEEFKAKAAEATKELAEVRAANNSWWAWLKDGAGIAGALTAAAAALRALNVPGSQLIDPVARAILPGAFQKLQTKVTELGTQNQTLITAVAASDVGREALGALDAQLNANPAAKQAILEALNGITGGKATSLEGLFKVFAKGHAIDEGLAPEVDRCLATVRNTVPTTGGTSDSFLKIAQALVPVVMNRRA